MALATTVLFSPIFGVVLLLAQPIGLLFTVALVPPMLVFAYVWEVFVTLLYVDSRVRKEGYSRSRLNADLAGYG